MLIRSQDKTIIVNFDNAFNIATRDINGAVAIYIGTQGSCCNMAEYSAKAKAMKVLDMIQEAYSEYQIMLNFSVSYLHEFKEKTDGFAIFQMPEDSEVEA